MDYENRVAEAQEEYDALIDELLLNLHVEELVFTEIISKFPRTAKSYMIALQSAISVTGGTEKAEVSLLADTLMTHTTAILSAVVNHRTRQGLTSTDA